MALPEVLTLGTQAVLQVAEAVEALESGKNEYLDDGVLDSLNSLGSVFERKAITSALGRNVPVALVESEQD